MEGSYVFKKGGKIHKVPSNETEALSSSEYLHLIHIQYGNITVYHILYWRSLNLAACPQTTCYTVLADLNLAVWYSIAIHVRTCTCTQ